MENNQEQDAMRLLMAQIIKNNVPNEEDAAKFLEELESAEDISELFKTWVAKVSGGQSCDAFFLSSIRDREHLVIEGFHELLKAFHQIAGDEATLEFGKLLKHTYKAIPTITKAINPREFTGRRKRKRDTKPKFSDEVKNLIDQGMRRRDVVSEMIEWSKENQRHTKLVKQWMSAPSGEAKTEVHKTLAKSVRDRVRKLRLNLRKK